MWKNLEIGFDSVLFLHAEMPDDEVSGVKKREMTLTIAIMIVV